MSIDKSTPILVVDDYAVMLKIVRSILASLGFREIDEAADGRIALAKMRRRRYGLVISDWDMQPMSGHDLLRAVRAAPELSLTPFIMIAAAPRPENVAAATRDGANAFIAKPFSANILMDRIAHACRARAD